MDEYFSAWFPFPPCILTNLAHRANNFVRGGYYNNIVFKSSHFGDCFQSYRFLSFSCGCKVKTVKRKENFAVLKRIRADGANFKRILKLSMVKL